MYNRFISASIRVISPLRDLPSAALNRVWSQFRDINKDFNSHKSHNFQPMFHRNFYSTPIRNIVTENDPDLMSVTFVKPDGDKVTVKASQNKSLYDVVVDNDIDIDGFGACEGTLCCTTCHLIFKEDDYKKIVEPSDEELDMLDLAYGLTETSRLGCQVFLKKELDPLEVQVPASINDVREC